MIKELDRVILSTNLPEYGLKNGDIGTVVLMHDRNEGFEVEFVSLDGETVAVVSLFTHQVRPIGRREIAHARPLASP
jgi:ATP-dependent exoDNAse (exonuclease V) alpha subunit